METLFYSTIPSPVGPLTIVVSDTPTTALVPQVPGSPTCAVFAHVGVEVRAVLFGANLGPEFGSSLPKMSATLVHSPDKTSACRRELDEYFSGSRKTFSVPLDLRGTEFQLRCWRALLEIPYGETRTYAELARAVGCPNGFRAVGMANHDNPIAIIVPCHRVVASDGKLGGYGGGLDAKRWLLELEGVKWGATRGKCSSLTASLF
jgi:O-6-methylguanine DNA methyltransferase